MKIKKILSLVLAFSMIMTTMGIVAFAEVESTVNGKADFATAVAEAVAAAEEGTTIVLTQNTTITAEDVAALNEKSVTLDVDEYILTVTSLDDASDLISVPDGYQIVKNATEDETGYEYSLEKKSSNSRRKSGSSTVKVEEITCTVKFDTDGGSTAGDYLIYSGGTLGGVMEPRKEGHIFDGWYTDKTFATEYDFGAKVTKNFTLYAKWLKTEDIDLSNAIVLTIGKTEATVFGEETENDVAPIIVKERTMLPARFVAESLGAEVNWDAEKRTVTITKDDIEIVILIDSATAWVNGEEATLGSPAFIQNDRTYTPIRFISENLGGKVLWDPDGMRAIIMK